MNQWIKSGLFPTQISIVCFPWNTRKLDNIRMLQHCLLWSTPEWSIPTTQELQDQLHLFQSDELSKSIRKSDIPFKTFPRQPVHSPCSSSYQPQIPSQKTQTGSMLCALKSWQYFPVVDHLRKLPPRLQTGVRRILLELVVLFFEEVSIIIVS